MSQHKSTYSSLSSWISIYCITAKAVGIYMYMGLRASLKVGNQDGTFLIMLSSCWFHVCLGMIPLVICMVCHSWGTCISWIDLVLYTNFWMDKQYTVLVQYVWHYLNACTSVMQSGVDWGKFLLVLICHLHGIICWIFSSQSCPKKVLQFYSKCVYCLKILIQYSLNTQLKVNQTDLENVI